MFSIEHVTRFLALNRETFFNSEKPHLWANQNFGTDVQNAKFGSTGIFRVVRPRRFLRSVLFRGQLIEIDKKLSIFTGEFASAGKLDFHKEQHKRQKSAYNASLSFLN